MIKYIKPKLKNEAKIQELFKFDFEIGTSNKPPEDIITENEKTRKINFNIYKYLISNTNQSDNDIDKKKY